MHCSRRITSVSRAKLRNVSLAVSLFLLYDLSGPSKIEDVISKASDKDFDSELLATQVYKLNICQSVSHSIVWDLRKV